MFVVEAATEATPEVVAAVGAMLPLLSRSAPAPSAEEVAEIVTSPATTLFVARDDGGAIVGILTLAVFRIPSGVRAWIEDVIVGEAARRGGCGEALTRAAIAAAEADGARTVDLTSRPAREGANRLYRRIGFVERDTNVYRYDPEANAE
jgi:ribosomal protein S18 acetylase RimI-like enzyme